MDRYHEAFFTKERAMSMRKRLTRLFTATAGAAFGLAMGCQATQSLAQAPPAADQLSLAPKYLAQEAPAPSGGDDSVELAKKLSNPIANLISVPLQFNYDEGFGPKDAYKLTLNVQPVIPITLNIDWNVIVRTIVPVVYQDSLADGIDSKFGLGDTLQSFFFSPKEPTSGGWIWGVGPAFLWPTGTDDILGSEKWGAGPTAVLLKQEKGWTYGALGNHIWSYAGDGERNEVNASFIQPFLTYTWPTATTLGVNTESTYDWNDSQWTIPLNLTFGQIMKFGKLPVQLAIGPRYYAASPDGGPEWGARFTMTFLFPK
jgi:hypothetical protein